MSQQADGLKVFDRQSNEERGLVMQCNQLHEKTKSYPFLSSKSTSSSNNNVIDHAHQSSFIDDDLVTWLQYPSDEGVACHDMFQHWPAPPPSPYPPPLHFASSLSLKEPLHQQNEASMVNLAPDENLNFHEGCVSVENDQKPATRLNQVSCLEGSFLQEVLVGEAQQLDPLIKHGNKVASVALEAVNMQQVSGSTSESRGVSKEIRKLPQLNFSAQVEDSSGRTVAKEASNAGVHYRHIDKRIMVVGEDPASFQAMRHAQANAAADAALALGAGRAAGVIRPSGVEAFCKVRTSLRPVRPLQLGSPPAIYTLPPTSPAGKYTSYPTGYPPHLRERAFGFHDYALSAQPFQQELYNAAQPYLFRPCVDVSGMASQEHQSMHPVFGDIENSSKSSYSVSSMGPHGKEDISVGSKQMPCTEQAKIIGADSCAAAAFGMDIPDTHKPSGVSLPYRDRKDEVVISGGSETSESLKETFSSSKRKPDESECQSEDAEGESTVNSQSRSSNLKRTRVNEVHNLSERRRRNRINDKMNALRDLIPNATKTNKAALLDEAIDYLKNLQLQLQVMSMRTGVSLHPMVLPSALPHMQMPIQPLGIGMTGGCSLETGLGGAGSTVGVPMCDMMYAIPAGSLPSLKSPNSTILQPPANNLEPHATSVHELALPQFSQPSQPPFPVNMDVYNSYLQHQQLQQQLHHQEQVTPPQVQSSSEQPPLSQQQSQYEP